MTNNTIAYLGCMGCAILMLAYGSFESANSFFAASLVLAGLDKE